MIYGATGFTGRLAIQYVARQYGSKIKWAIAGRSSSKLTELAQTLGEGYCSVLVADSSDPKSLAVMCSKTSVVATAAGPFARYGTPVVDACVKAGIDYCDITGETAWVRDMIADYDDAARKSGSRIVHLCGHDSVPWDLSTFMLAKQLKNKHNETLAKVDFYDDIKSEPSGGTLETAFGIMFGKESKSKKSAAQKELGYDPLLKTPSGKESTNTLSAKNVALYKAPTHASLPHRALFFMAGVNAYTVKRSNAVNGYGAKVVYCEGQAFPSFFAAACNLLGLALFGICLYIPPVRWLMRKFLLPKPGEGPSAESMEKGYLNVLGVAKGSNGTVVKSTMSFKVDPGYKDTARMLVESALALSLEGDKIKSGGGVWTPGCCQKEVLLERLLKTGTAFAFHDEAGTTKGGKNQL